MQLKKDVISKKLIHNYHKFFIFNFVVLFLIIPALNFIFKEESNSTSFLIFIILFFLFLVIFFIEIKFHKINVLIVLFLIILVDTFFSDICLNFFSYKQIGSLLILFLFFIVLSILSYIFKIIDYTIIYKILTYLFYIYVLIFIFSLFIKIGYPYYFKPIFPFTEPSFYSINFSIFMFFMFYKHNQKQFLLILFFLIVGIFIENLTFFGILVLILIVCFKFKKIFISLVIITLLLFIFRNINDTIIEKFNLTYYTNRLQFNEENDNLTVLCFNLGLEMAQKDLKNTNGIGVGFQQMGLFYKNYNFDDLIVAIFGDSLNLYDGTFYAAKIISEFGCLGIFFLLYYLYCFYKSILYLKTNSFNKNNIKIILICIIIITSFVDIFIRAQGSYFTPKFFILCFALLNFGYLNKQSNQYKINEYINN